MSSPPVRHAWLETPLGPVVVAATGRGVVRLAFPDGDPEAILEEVGLALGRPLRADRRAFDGLARDLDRYFARRGRGFRLPADLALIPAGFGRRVLEATARVPYGAVATYGRVAALAGSPRAARAAGNALRANPVSLLVPCHRVVPADGSLGGYGGDEWRKEALLRLEGALGEPRRARAAVRSCVR
ncbi:MAG TPA: methylated-DNA--[protein]-cysteine S-methyltransferase [Actinomycetota bacterium]|nr:methylated-DNA--[protein]-cysteine S-methyltransferase [Actinomycetota bacterium]